VEVPVNQFTATADWLLHLLSFFVLFVLLLILLLILIIIQLFFLFLLVIDLAGRGLGGEKVVRPLGYGVLTRIRSIQFQVKVLCRRGICHCTGIGTGTQRGTEVVAVTRGDI
jgi:hypothetical protein